MTFALPRIIGQPDMSTYFRIVDFETGLLYQHMDTECHLMDVSDSVIALFKDGQNATGNPLRGETIFHVTLQYGGRPDFNENSAASGSKGSYRLREKNRLPYIAPPVVCIERCAIQCLPRDGGNEV